MNLDLTEEQQILETSARNFLEKEFPKKLVRLMEENHGGHDTEIWKKMAKMGWTGMLVPEKYGGTGLSFLDMVILLEEMGRACLVGPFFTTAILGALPILAAGNEEQKQKFLPKIARGDMLLTLALTEPSASYEASAVSTMATTDKDGYTIRGLKLFVDYAHIADSIICVAKTGNSSKPENGISLFLIDAKIPGIGVTPLSTISDDKQNEVVFNNVKVSQEDLLGRLNKGWPIIKRLLEQARVAKCAEMVGGAEWVVDDSVAYAKQRIQYGRPIGSFQVIQHYLADMWVKVNMAKRLTYHAAWLVEEGLPCAKEVASAKACVNNAYRHCARMGVQVHGGIGTTRDHDVGLYYRRAIQSTQLFGNTDLCYKIVAKEIGC